MKLFYTVSNVGNAKYTINMHDGVSKHQDGSNFYGIELFKNKRKYNAAIRSLIKNGYTER